MRLLTPTWRAEAEMQVWKVVSRFLVLAATTDLAAQSRPEQKCGHGTRDGAERSRGPMGQGGRSDPEHRESPKQNDKGRTGRHNTFEGGSGSAVRSTNGDKTYLTINNNN